MVDGRCLLRLRVDVWMHLAATKVTDPAVVCGPEPLLSEPLVGSGAWCVAAHASFRRDFTSTAGMWMPPPNSGPSSVSQVEVAMVTHSSSSIR